MPKIGDIENICGDTTVKQTMQVTFATFNKISKNNGKKESQPGGEFELKFLKQ
jgi:hypothetical protein